MTYDPRNNSLSFTGNILVDVLIYGTTLYAYFRSDITEKYSLEAVKSLDLGGCSLGEIPRNLPEGLEVLIFFHNNATDIPPLPKSLKVLYVDWNNLKTFPDLDLPNLRKLYCENNQLTTLPEKLIRNLDVLDFSDNPIRFVPFLPKEPKMCTPKIENYQEKFRVQQRGRFLIPWLFEEFGFHSEFLETEFSLQLLF